jgi:hypothetical protein
MAVELIQHVLAQIAVAHETLADHAARTAASAGRQPGIDTIHQSMGHLSLSRETLAHQPIYPQSGDGAGTGGLAPADGPPPSGGGSGPNFSNIAPNSNGVPKTGVMFTIAEVTMFFGLGILFLVGLWELIKWGAGQQFGGMHVSQQAKANIARALVCGIALTVAGGIWTWITALN